MHKSLVLLGLLFALSYTVEAQTFSSGSTGADGPLDLSTLTCPQDACGCRIQLPESGILNYTTVNIPSGKTLSFKSNLRNTPVIMLAQGAVTISGTIIISNGFSLSLPCSGDPAAPGPGGFSGGAPGQNGFGPGGGNAADINGRWIGPLSLVPIVGGSGGKGSTSNSGGGGGGAIVIASSASIALPQGGSIFAQSTGGFGGHGSGGAIRLVANSISVAGQFVATAQDPGHPGIIRLEAPAGSLSFTGTSSPTAVLSTTINPAILADSNTPSFTITSIAGFAVPSYTTARPDVVDLLLPSQLTDPLNVVVHGHNIPVGTQVSVNVSGSIATVTSASLSGTLDSSTATLSVSGLNRTAVSTFYVFATFTPGSSTIEAANPKGPDQVAKVRVEAAPGAKPRFVFLRSDGTVIDRSKLSRVFLEQFGL